MIVTGSWTFGGGGTQLTINSTCRQSVISMVRFDNPTCGKGKEVRMVLTRKRCEDLKTVIAEVERMNGWAAKVD